MASRDRFWLVLLVLVGVGDSVLAQGWRTTPYRLQDPPGQSVATPGDRAGSRVVVLGDVNGDGRDDIAIGAPGASVIGFSGAGRVEVRSGHDMQTLATAYGSFAGDGMGMTLARVPDLDGDGVDDLAAGLAAAPGRAARIHWISAATGISLGETPLAGTAGTRSHPVVRPWRDLTGDGLVDYVVAGLRDASEGISISVLDRVSGVTLLSVALPLVDSLVSWPRPDVLLTTQDLDGDALAEVLVACPHAAVVGSPLTGSRGVVVSLSGSSVTPQWLRAGLVRDGAFGAALLTVPDLDGDESREVLVGEPGLAGTAGSLIALSGTTGQPLLAVSSTSVAVGGLGSSLVRHSDPLQAPQDELVLAGCAPVPGGPGVLAVGFAFGPYGAVQTGAVFAADATTLSADPRSVLAAGGDFDGNGRPDVAIGVDALGWSTSIHWFRTAGSFLFGTLDPTTQALQLDGSFQGWRVRGGTAGSPCLCTVGLVRGFGTIQGVSTYVDLSVPGTWLFWTETFDTVGRASFLVSTTTPLPLVPGLTLQVQGFTLGSGTPPALLASNGLQITL